MKIASKIADPLAIIPENPSPGIILASGPHIAAEDITRTDQCIVTRGAIRPDLRLFLYWRYQPIDSHPRIPHGKIHDISKQIGTPSLPHFQVRVNGALVVHTTYSLFEWMEFKSPSPMGLQLPPGPLATQMRRHSQQIGDASRRVCGRPT